MIQHLRTHIKNSVRTALLGQTMAADRVFVQRHTPLFEAELPCLLIYADLETVARFLQSPRENKRYLSLILEGIVQAGNNIDEQLELFAQQIEQVLDADPTFNGYISDSQLTQTKQTVSNQGKQLIGSIALTVEVIYFTQSITSGKGTSRVYSNPKMSLK